MTGATAVGQEPVTPDVPGAPRGTVEELRSLFLDGRPLLDVRAPVEFAKGAFPGAVNEPLLTDAERHDVGVRYKQQGQDAAIALGAELVAPPERERRVARWKAFAEAHPDGALYCFRGGLRSRIAQHWLSEAGVELPLVTGGYKAMRTFLMDELQRLCGEPEEGPSDSRAVAGDAPATRSPERSSPDGSRRAGRSGNGGALDLRLVGGRTGVGKTLLIHRLGRTVDLEGIARHRGSSFGALAEPQPGNIDFENRVTIELMRLAAEDEAALDEGDGGASGGSGETSSARRPVWLEDEARLIGRVAMPEALVAAMRRAPLVVLEASMATRVGNCLDDYVVDLSARYRAAHGDEAGFEAYAAHHRGSLDRVRKRFGGDNHARASLLLGEALDAHRANGDTDAYVPFIELMLERYYDPMYDYQIDGKRERVRFTGDAEAILDHVRGA